jgi:hypothetical protein
MVIKKTELSKKPRLVKPFDQFFGGDDGRWVIVQWPNLPISVAVVATILKNVVPFGMANYTVALIAFGAFFTWSWLEIFDGNSMFRRVLGLVVMVFLIKSQLT